MSNQQHRIIPPPELVLQWRVEAANRQYVSFEFDEYIAEEAAQWGADQELEACCALIEQKGFLPSSLLRAVRRPKPPSLKEQALADFDWLVGRTLGRPEFDERSERIRRALEQLND